MTKLQKILSDLLICSWVSLICLSATTAYSWTWGNGHSYAKQCAMSGNGRYVAFESDATNLVAGDTNACRDVFVLDTQNGNVRRVSLTAAGEQRAYKSTDAAINFDGTRVVYRASLDNLGSSDVNLASITPGTITTTRANLRHDGTAPSVHDSSDRPALSADGSKVVFCSWTRDLVLNDTNNKNDIFVRDIVAGTTVRVSVSTAGVQSDQDSVFPVISADGARVAFESTASTLVPGGTPGRRAIYVRDLTAGTTVRASVNTAEVEAGADCLAPTINADGSRVAFYTEAALAGGDTNGTHDVYIRDLGLAQTLLCSVNTAGTIANGGSGFSAINADGTKVAFTSMATNMAPLPENGFQDIFLRDLTDGTTTLVSKTPAGLPPNFMSNSCAISADGTRVAFTSYANNMVAGDGTTTWDVFTWDRSADIVTVPVQVSRVEIE